MTPRDLRVGGAVTVTPPAIPIVTPTWAETLVAGDESDGTSPVISTGDELLGETDLALRAQGTGNGVDLDADALGEVTLSIAASNKIQVDADRARFNSEDAAAAAHHWELAAGGGPSGWAGIWADTARTDANYRVACTATETKINAPGATGEVRISANNAAHCALKVRDDTAVFSAGADFIQLADNALASAGARIWMGTSATPGASNWTLKTDDGRAHLNADSAGNTRSSYCGLAIDGTVLFGLEKGAGTTAFVQTYLGTIQFHSTVTPNPIIRTRDTATTGTAMSMTVVAQSAPNGTGGTLKLQAGRGVTDDQAGAVELALCDRVKLTVNHYGYTWNF